MQLPVWISILFTLIGTIVSVKNFEPWANQVSVCVGSSSCTSFSLNCSRGERIQVNSLQYGIHGQGHLHCTNTDYCENESCCTYVDGDCLQNFSKFHKNLILSQCSGISSCGPIPAVYNAFNALPNCQGPTSQYVVIEYTCIHENTIVDMCNAKVKHMTEANIMFQKQKSTLRDSTQCYCQVRATASVKYQLVDIRLFTNVTTEDKYSCVNGSFAIHETQIQCNSGPNDPGFIDTKSPSFEGEIPAMETLDMRLSYQGNVHPDMVWVNLKASDNLEIYCQDSLPPTVTTKTTATETTTKTATQNGTGATVQVSSTTKGPTGLPSGTSSYTSSGHELSMPDQGSNRQTLSIILGVIGGAVVISIVTVVIIIYKRRQKKTTEKAAPNNDLPNGMMNCGYESCKESQESVQCSNYDIINDESIVTYSQPFKKKKDAENIFKDETKYGDYRATNEYDRIEFARKCAKNGPNYDSLPAMEGVLQDDTYAHASSQTTSDPTYNATTSSRGKFDGKDLTREDNCTKTAVKDENLKDDDYSRCDLDVEWKKDGHPRIIEEDSYNHIDLIKLNILQKMERP